MALVHDGASAEAAMALMEAWVKEIRFAIIGCGLKRREFASASARWMHLTGLKARPRIVTNGDRNPVLTDWFTAALGPLYCATDCREILALAKVDVV